MRHSFSDLRFLASCDKSCESLINDDEWFQSSVACCIRMIRWSSLVLFSPGLYALEIVVDRAYHHRRVVCLFFRSIQRTGKAADVRAICAHITQSSVSVAEDASTVSLSRHTLPSHGQRVSPTDRLLTFARRQGVTSPDRSLLSNHRLEPRRSVGIGMHEEQHPAMAPSTTVVSQRHLSLQFYSLVASSRNNAFSRSAFLDRNER